MDGETLCRVHIADSRQWTCPEDSPLKQRALSTVLNEDDQDDYSIDGVKSFVGDFYMSTDVCYNPELRNQVSHRGIYKLTRRTRLRSTTSGSQTCR